MRRSPELEDRLSRHRWRAACLVAEEFLREEVGLSSGSFSSITYEESKEQWEQFMPRAHAQNDLLLQWPESESAGVRRWLDAVRSRFRGRRVLWFAHVDTGVPPVADVPVENLLEVGFDVFAMKGRDLMLASHDLRDGLSIEVIPIGMQVEFEAAAWGDLAETE